MSRSEIANGVFRALKSVIESETQHTFYYTKSVGGYDIAVDKGGGFITPDHTEFYVSPLGNQRPKTNWRGTSPSATFFHEIVHFNNNILPGVPSALAEGRATNMASRATQVMQPWSWFVPHSPSPFD